MNDRIKKLLDCFEPNMQRQLIDFCTRISKTQADVFILMARKASCFFNCLEELGLIHFNGYVTSERILDMDCQWLQGKKVIVIDDAIVSGTSINRTICKLIENKVASVEVHVLTVNKKWFQKDMLENEYGVSYLYPNCNVETNEKCIELCYNVVKSILLQPRPYDIDFPYYHKIELKEAYLDYLLNREGWDWYETTSVEQKQNNVFTFTIIPTDLQLKQFEKVINFSFFDKCLVKLRVYGTYKDKNKKTYSIRLVPMIVFDRIPIREIEAIFFELMDQVENGSYFIEMFNTATSKLRFLQFFFSNKFARFWIAGLPKIIGVSVDELTFEDRNLSFIFPEEVDKGVEQICKSDIVLVHKYEGLNTADKTVVEESAIVEKDYISIETRLMEPFINKYYNKELPCRELVLKEGKKVFQNVLYDELLQRLNCGITIYDMLENIKYAQDYYDIYTRVSLFVDRAIDMGMIVPIIQISDGYVFRAFRHGEDVLFGQREEILYLKLLHEYQETSKGERGITHISTEKMIVLFTKIGIKSGFLHPYVSNFTINPKDNNGNICKVLRVKTYLKGPVALVADVNTHKTTKERPYITEEGKSIWFTNTFIQKQKILSDKSGRYHIPEVDTSSITTTDLAVVENMGILFGELCNPNTDTGITLGDEELTKIATCLTLEDVVKAVAAEINIFVKEWEYTSLTYDKECDERILNDGKNCRVYEALNSAYMKMSSYESGEAKGILERVKFKRRTDQNLWESWFDDIIHTDNTNNQLNKDALRLFYESKYLTVLLLYTYHLLLSIQFINFKYYSKSKKYAYIEDSYRKMTEYETILQNMSIPNSFYENLNWNCVYKIKTEIQNIYPKENIGENISQKIEDYQACHVIEFIEKAIMEANCYLEDVCCIIGEKGKVSKMHIYNHMLAIPFYFRNELEEEYVYDKIDFCYQHALRLLENKRLNGTQREEIKIEYLSPKNKPDIEIGENISIVWFVARGNGVEEILTKLALNIFYKLNGSILFKEIYFSEVGYKYSIKKSENKISDFICNSFYRFVEDIPISIFQIKELKPTITTITENGMYAKSQFIYFINHDKNAKNKYVKCDKRNIQATCSEYIVEKYQYNSKEEESMDKKDIGIITILPEEAAAVIETFDLQEKEFKMGERLYYIGHSSGEKVVHSIVMTQQLSQGEVSVVSAYNDMVKKYNPSMIFLIGIAGGITDDVDYCSVVLGRQIISYDLMKDAADGIHRRGDVNKVSAQILPLYQRLITKINKEALQAAPNSKKDTIHVCESNIGSGSAVIANSLSDIKKWIHNYNDKTDAVEMEAYGLSTAFYEGQLSNRKPKYGIQVIRGISDMANEKKSKIKKYRVPAAENAAIVLKELIKLIPKL